MFSVPLSVTICNGVLCLGMISSSTRWTTVSAFLSGTAKASAQQLYQSTKCIMHLLLIKLYGKDQKHLDPTLQIESVEHQFPVEVDYLSQVSFLTDYTWVDMLVEFFIHIRPVVLTLDAVISFPHCPYFHSYHGSTVSLIASGD